MQNSVAPRPKAIQLQPTMEALGLVLSFICRSAPYDEFRAAKLIKAVQHQLSTGCHACLIEDERLIAYAGWLPVAPGNAEKWLDGKTNLLPVPSFSTNVAALTIVSVLHTRDTRQLLQTCRRLAPQNTVYFKRSYSDGRSKKTKLTVPRTTSSAPP
jgi:hemolysin-activating ACP:hemolysin acyltransferase